MYDDEIDRLRVRLATLTGPGRLRPLVDYGQQLMARAWRSGMGSEAAKPDLDAAVAAMREARGYLDEADTSRILLEANLGMLIGGRVLAYSGSAEDREEGIEVLRRPVESPIVQPALRDGCRLLLGQLYLHRTFRIMLDPGAGIQLMRGGPSAAAADLDRAAAWFHRILDGPPASAESGQMATAMLQATDAMRAMFGAGPKFDLGGVITAMQGFQRMQEEARRGGAGMPIPSIFDAEEMIRGEAIDFPVMVVPGPETASPPGPAPVPRPETALPPGLEAASPRSATSYRPAAPVSPQPSEPPPPLPSPEPEPARPVPAQRTPQPAPDLDRLRRIVRDRLVRGADPFTAILARLRPGVPPLPVAVVDELVAVTTAILHRGGDQVGDRVLAAFALAQRSRLGPGGTWDDDPREAGRCLIAAGDGLLDAPAPLVTAALTLAGTLEEEGTVLTALAGCFARVQKTLEDLGAAGLVYPRPGGAIVLEGGRFRSVPEGAPLPRRVVAIGRRTLPVLDTTISYATTATQLITVAARRRPAWNASPVVVTGGPGAAIVPGVIREGATVLHQPAPAVLLERLDASLLHLGCGVTAEGVLDLVEPPALAAIAAGRARGGLVIVSPAGAGLPVLADALLTAGCTGVIGWLRPVPDPVAGAAMVVLHDRLIRSGQEPAEAVRQVRAWLRDPGREAVPGLPDGWGTTFGRRQDDAPGHAAALVLRGV